MYTLTKKQYEVYKFCCEYFKDYMMFPAIRDICEGLGLKSTSTVHYHLQSLYEKGLLEQRCEGSIYTITNARVEILPTEIRIR